MVRRKTKTILPRKELLTPDERTRIFTALLKADKGKQPTVSVGGSKFTISKRMRKR